MRLLDLGQKHFNGFPSHIGIRYQPGIQLLPDVSRFSGKGHERKLL